MYCEVTNVTMTKEGRVRFQIRAHDTNGEVLFYGDGMRYDLETNEFFTAKFLKGGLRMDLCGVGGHRVSEIVDALKKLLKQTEGMSKDIARGYSTVVWGTKRESARSTQYSYNPVKGGSEYED